MGRGKDLYEENKRLRAKVKRMNNQENKQNEQVQLGIATVAMHAILSGGWANTVPYDDPDHARQLAGFSAEIARELMAQAAPTTLEEPDDA